MGFLMSVVGHQDDGAPLTTERVAAVTVAGLDPAAVHNITVLKITEASYFVFEPLLPLKVCCGAVCVIRIAWIVIFIVASV